MAASPRRARCSGSTILTRTDLLPVPFLIAGASVGADRADPPPRSCATLMTSACWRSRRRVVLAPWTIYASNEEGRFIPVTKGSAAALFVGTYLPGRRHDDRA